MPGCLGLLPGGSQWGLGVPVAAPGGGCGGGGSLRVSCLLIPLECR